MLTNITIYLKPRSPIVILLKYFSQESQLLKVAKPSETS